MRNHFVVLLLVTACFGCTNQPSTVSVPVPATTPDYDKMPLSELLIEAKAAGLNPCVTDGNLRVDNAPHAQDIARALFRREQEVIQFLDPDAFLKKQIVGKWTQENHGNRKGITASYEFKNDGTMTIRHTANDPIRAVLEGSGGTTTYKWSIKDKVMTTVYADNDSALDVFGIANAAMRGETRHIGIISIGRDEAKFGPEEKRRGCIFGSGEITGATLRRL